MMMNHSQSCQTCGTRFHPNAIVRYLLDAAGTAEPATLQTIAKMGFSAEDVRQFEQLLGYSGSGSVDAPSRPGISGIVVRTYATYSAYEDPIG